MKPLAAAIGQGRIKHELLPHEPVSSEPVEAVGDHVVSERISRLPGSPPQPRLFLLRRPVQHTMQRRDHIGRQTIDHLRQAIGQRRLLRRQPRRVDPHPGPRKSSQMREIVSLIPDQAERIRSPDAPTRRTECRDAHAPTRTNRPTTPATPPRGASASRRARPANGAISCRTESCARPPQQQSHRALIGHTGMQGVGRMRMRRGQHHRADLRQVEPDRQLSHQHATAVRMPRPVTISTHRNRSAWAARRNASQRVKRVLRRHAVQIELSGTAQLAAVKSLPGRTIEPRRLTANSNGHWPDRRCRDRCR